jgi:hypothetical protein
MLGVPRVEMSRFAHATTTSPAQGTQQSAIEERSRGERRGSLPGAAVLPSIFAPGTQPAATACDGSAVDGLSARRDHARGTLSRASRHRRAQVVAEFTSATVGAERQAQPRGLHRSQVPMARAWLSDWLSDLTECLQNSTFPEPTGRLELPTGGLRNRCSTG